MRTLEEGPGTPEGGPLENNANKVSPLAQISSQKRAARWANRAILWEMSSLKRVRHCGRVPRSRDEGVTLRRSELGAGYAGLQHCASVWACSVCAGKILAHRALENGAMLGEAIRRGHSLGFVTFTMRHRRGQSLDLLWSAGQKAWKRVVSGKAWIKHQKRFGIAGFVRVWEVTEGINGWHVHVHVVFVLPPGATSAHLDEWAGPAFGRWSRGLVAAGLAAPLVKAQDWHVVDGEKAADEVAEYLFSQTKSVDWTPTREQTAKSLGWELMSSMPGRSSTANKTRPVWALLQDLEETGEKSAVDRWHEWERVSKGKRQMGYSTGFRERFGVHLDAELDDQAVVDVEHGSSDDNVIHWTVDQWRDFVRVPSRLLDLLEAAEASGPVGLEAVRTLLDEWGIGYSVVRAPDGTRSGPPADRTSSDRTPSSEKRCHSQGIPSG